MLQQPRTPTGQGHVSVVNSYERAVSHPVGGVDESTDAERDFVTSVGVSEDDGVESALQHHLGGANVWHGGIAGPLVRRPPMACERANSA